MTGSRRAVFVCCDGLGRDWVRPDKTPVLERLKAGSAWCEDHRGVFPSVTRVSAASIATGCQPARHGLQGNRMGLLEGGRIGAAATYLGVTLAAGLVAVRVGVAVTEGLRVLLGVAVRVAV